MKSIMAQMQQQFVDRREAETAEFARKQQEAREHEKNTLIRDQQKVLQDAKAKSSV